MDVNASASSLNALDLQKNSSTLKMTDAAKKVGNLHAAVAFDPVKAKATAQDFEASFLTQMIGYMHEGIGTDENFGGGESEDVYKSMLDDQYGKLIAKSGGVGIANAVYKTMLEQQEAATKPQPAAKQSAEDKKPQASDQGAPS